MSTDANEHIASTLRPIIADICAQIDRVEARAVAAINTLQADRATFRLALQRMVEGHEKTESDSEGRYPLADPGCIDCTLGTVPNHLNTGLCAFHAAKRLLLRLNGHTAPTVSEALFATAPDLLAILKEGIDNQPDYVGWLRRARVIIAKAEGRAP